MWLTPSREIWVRDLIGSVLRQSNVLSKCLVHPGENRLVQVNCQENMTKMLLGGGGREGKKGRITSIPSLGSEYTLGRFLTIGIGFSSLRVKDLSYLTVF